jgi:hypothetical protein
VRIEEPSFGANLHAAKAAPAANMPAAFLTASEAAHLRLVALSRWRGQGRALRKFGRRAAYAHEKLMMWAAKQARISTSERGD